jgi:anti-anti-sigma regulatory factor
MSTTQTLASTHPHRDDAAPLCLRLLAGDPVRIEAWGELGAGTGHLLIELVEHVLRAGPAAVALDLSRTRTLSADGVRVLGLAQTMIVAAGARVSVAGTRDGAS